MAMTTKITVVDGADGLTPEMLRKRPRYRETYAYYTKLYPNNPTTNNKGNK